MNFGFEERGSDGEFELVKPFKTLRGATSFGCKRLKVPGYQACNQWLGSGTLVWQKTHIVAEWKSNGRQIARVVQY